MIRRADYYRKLPVVGKKQWKWMARLVYFTVYGIESNVREQTAHVTVGNSDRSARCRSESSRCLFTTIHPMNKS
ncbi:hypothetical protein NLX67_01270 [Domibacillus sp. A3M-37]|nr:hypothetical protein [Domibacillus sp. A3M-37]